MSTLNAVDAVPEAAATRWGYSSRAVAPPGWTALATPKGWARTSVATPKGWARTSVATPKGWARTSGGTPKGWARTSGGTPKGQARTSGGTPKGWARTSGGTPKGWARTSGATPKGWARTSGGTPKGQARTSGGTVNLKGTWEEHDVESSYKTKCGDARIVGDSVGGSSHTFWAPSGKVDEIRHRAVVAVAQRPQRHSSNLGVGYWLSVTATMMLA
eukprot:364033-Chlamydomonas_euryale.AAC.18